MRKVTMSVTLFMTSYLFAMDIEQQVDLSVLVGRAINPALQGELSSYQQPDTLLNATVSAFWNLHLYPSADTQVVFRYGLSALSELGRSDTAAISDSQGADFRVDDLPEKLDIELYQQLDQFNVVWYSPVGDFIFGRQPISFGIARFYSPVDVIQPLKVLSSERSYRPGVDAFRASWVLGAVSELEMGYVYGEDTALFGRLKAYMLGSDLELTNVLINQNNLITAIGLNSALGSVGLWQETAILVDYDKDEKNIRLTVGADYTFFKNLYVFSEIHYNGIGQDNGIDQDNGAGQGNDYSQNYGNSFYQLGLVVPQAQLYASIQGSYPLNILTQFSAGGTVNINDGSTLINGALMYSASNNMSIGFNAVVPFVSEHTVDYEFALLPVSIELTLDWVF